MHMLKLNIQRLPDGAIFVEPGAKVNGQYGALQSHEMSTASKHISAIGRATQSNC